MKQLYGMGAKLIKSPGFQKGGQGMSLHCLIKAHLEITFTQTPSPPKECFIPELSVPHTSDPGFY